MTQLGDDLSGHDDLDASLAPATGRRALAQAIARRLSTRRGGLFYAPHYGYDLKRFIGTTVQPAIIQAGAEAECLKDERVFDARVTVTRQLQQSGAESLEIDIRLVDDEGPFDFTISTDGLSTSIFL